jgi:hypothetical protein
MKKSAVSAVALLLICSMGILTEGEARGQFLQSRQHKIRIQKVLDSEVSIDPEKVDDAQLKELGETVMNRIIADPVLRSWINETMGGNNSECLKDMYKIIGYRFLHDQYTLRESTSKNRFSAGHAVVRSRIRDEGREFERQKIGTETLMSYLVFLFLLISALGSLIYMVRLFRERM